MNSFNVIITGATGMVGEGVLHECLQRADIDNVLVIGRSPCGYTHPKLSEILHSDLGDISSMSAQVTGYQACYFCLGTTAAGKSEAQYTAATHTLTLGFASTLAVLNPEMTFCYITGAGADSSEQGRIMWARVKGRVENDLIKLPFKAAYNFRPSGLEPFLPLKPTQTYYTLYKYTRWLLPLIKRIAPNSMVPLQDLAAAMIQVSMTGYSKNAIEVSDIKLLAQVLR
jgi:uncharacterized protein YbjT (DUF2867 family)